MMFFRIKHNRSSKRVCIFFSWVFLSLNVLGGKCYAGAESQVRAQFIYNFANYVEWPESAFKKPGDPLTVCLLGRMDFAGYLQSFDGAFVGDNPLKIFVSDNLNEVRSGCHILYVSKQAEVELPDIWNQIEYMYVLSVGNRSEFTDRGGIINIFRTSDRVQFDVNIDNALLNGLFLDSDLLSLARTIKRHTQAK